MLCNGGGWGVSNFKEKCYEGQRFNVISVTRGWVGVQFPRKRCYVTLEWPNTHISLNSINTGAEHCGFVYMIKATYMIYPFN